MSNMAYKNWLAVVGLVVIAAVFAYISQSESILSVSSAKIGSDGNPYWVMYMSPSIDQGKLTFFGDVKQLEPYTDAQGGKIVPKNSFEIVFDTKNPTCSYQMTDVTGTLASLFEPNTKYYTISLEAEKTQLSDVYLNDVRKTTLDMFDIGQTYDLSLDPGITMQVQGALAGKSDCPSGYDVEIKYNYKTTVIEIRKRSSWIPELRDDFTSQFPLGCQPSTGFNQLVCSKSFKDLGSGTLTVTASTKFLDYYYIPPEVAQPEILDIEVPTPAGSLNTEAVKVTIKNPGSTKATYGLKFTSSQASFSPSSTSVTVNPNTFEKVSTTMVPMKVTSSTTGKLCVEAYTMSQFGGTKKDYECKDFTIKPTGLIINPQSCGNGVCDSNENYATCSKDCKQTLICPDKYLMHVIDGECVCVEAYQRKTDAYGNEYCTKKTDWLPWIIIGSALVITAAIVFSGKRRKR